MVTFQLSPCDALVAQILLQLQAVTEAALKLLYHLARNVQPGSDRGHETLVQQVDAQ